MSRSRLCQRPPRGWWCSLQPGHRGPCPTRPKTLRTRVQTWYVLWLSDRCARKNVVTKPRFLAFLELLLIGVPWWVALKAVRQ